MKGQREVGVKIKAPHFARLVARLTAAQSGCGTIDTPAHGRALQRLVDGIKIEAGHVQDADLRGVVGVAHLRDAFKILVAIEVNAGRASGVIVGDECRRRHLGSDREREGFGKLHAIDIRAEILAGGHGAGVLVRIKVVPAVEDDVLAALVDIGGRQSPVKESDKSRHGQNLLRARDSGTRRWATSRAWRSIACPRWRLHCG